MAKCNQLTPLPFKGLMIHMAVVYVGHGKHSCPVVRSVWQHRMVV